MNQYLVSAAMSCCFVSGILLRYIPFRKILDQKQKRLLFIGYALALIINAIIMIPLYSDNTHRFQYVEADMMAISAITMLWNMVVIRKHVREHLFVFGLVLCCNYLLLVIPVYVLAGMVLKEFTFNLSLVVVAAALLLLGYWPIRWLLLRTVTPFLDLESGNYWNTMWFIPLAHYLSVILSFPNDVVSATLPQVFSSILIGIVLALLCLSMSKDHQRMNDHQNLQKQIDAQKLHYAALSAKVENTRKTRHDYKHHIAAILRFIELDDKEGLRKYCNDYLGRIDSEGSIPYTGNSAADGVVYYCMQRCHEHNIDFHCTGVIRSSGIADMDLCVLLGNALDNAVSGCLTIDEGRTISLVSQSEPQLLSIIVRNSFDGVIQEKNDRILSRKREGRTGVGLVSMEEICSCYGGSMSTQWDENSFTVMFILPLSGETPRH